MTTLSRPPIARFRLAPRGVLPAALGATLLATEAAWAYGHREGLAYAPRPLALLPLSMLMLSSAVTLFVVWRVVSSPNFAALRDALRDGAAIAAGAVAVAAYLPAFVLGQDAVQQVANGRRLELVGEGAPGIAPVLMIFPFPNAGVVLGAYQIGALISLGLLVALNAAALTRLARMRAGGALWGGAGSSLGGAGLGLLLWCPTCVTTPLIAFVSAYLVPVLSFAPAAQSVMSAVVYLLSLLLLLIALDSSAAAIERGGACDVTGFGDAEGAPR